MSEEMSAELAGRRFPAEVHFGHISVRAYAGFGVEVLQKILILSSIRYALLTSERSLKSPRRRCASVTSVFLNLSVVLPPYFSKRKYSKSKLLPGRNANDTVCFPFMSLISNDL